MNKIEDNIKCASQHKRQEQAESSEVRVPLRAAPRCHVFVSRLHVARLMEADVLEFTRSKVCLCPNVLNSRARVPCELRLGGDSPHSLKGIDKEYSDESLRIVENNVLEANTKRT